MDEGVKQLKTPEACERYIKSVIAKQPDPAQEACRRSVELRASAHGAQGEIEKRGITGGICL